MNWPNYFLADLPVEATLTPVMITEACQTLRRNRARYLASKSTEHIVALLAQVAARWLEPDYPFRQRALELGPAATGFSRATLWRGLEAFFEQLTVESLNALLTQELGDAQRLDRFSAVDLIRRTSATAIIRGPELLVHITAGNVPSPALMSIVLGLLARSAQFVKCATGASLLPRLFAHSLYDEDPKLAACLEIAEWRGGNQSLESALFAEAECVTATGNDETLAAIRHRLPARARFLAHGHRLSFGYVSREAFAGSAIARSVASRAADDVAAWNQLGCLSPHIIYVQAGGILPPEQFAALLAEALAHLETIEPRGELPVEIAASIQSRRDLYRVRATASTGTLLWQSENSTAWTVIYEAEAEFQISCLHRFIFVKGVANLDEALRHAEPVHGRVSTVGLAAPRHHTTELAMSLARWGVTRVCPLGQMQRPPLTWHHDGRPALGDLVTWTDWEEE